MKHNKTEEAKPRKMIGGHLLLVALGALPWVWQINDVPKAIFNIATFLYFGFLAAMLVVVSAQFYLLSKNPTPSAAKEILKTFHTEPRSFNVTRVLCVISLVASGAFWGAVTLLVGWFISFTVKAKLEKISTSEK